MSMMSILAGAAKGRVTATYTYSANTANASLNITSLTGLYDLMNNGEYKYPDYPIRDIVYKGDVILVDNNTSKIVSSVDYLNKKIYLTTNLSSTTNSYLSVKRTFVSNTTLSSSQIKITSPIGQQFGGTATNTYGLTPMYLQTTTPVAPVVKLNVVVEVVWYLAPA